MEEQFLGHKALTTDVRRIQSTIGTLRAAGGLVVINPDGIYILASDAFADSRSYKFVDDSGDIVARVGAVHDDTVADYRSVDVRTLPHVGLDSIAWIVSESPEGNGCQANLWATHDSDTTDHEAFLSCDTNEANVSFIVWNIDGNWGGQFEDGHIYMGLDDNVTAGDDVRLQADWEVTYIASTRASKTNIVDYAVDRAKFAQLKPSRYNSVKAPDAPPMIGLVAEDIDEVFPDIVIWRQDRPPKGKPGTRPHQKPQPTGEPHISSWDNRQMQIMMISVIQQQERDIEDLKARVAALEARLG